MMMNMFWIFDPIMFNIPLNWIFLIFPFLIMKMNMWNFNSNVVTMLNKIIKKEIMENNPIMNKSMINLFMTMINMMIILNFMNIIPNMFYITSNFTFTLNMAFFFINMTLLFNLNNNYNIMFMNLTPKNTPIMLIFFINIIELNSFFIQILTLSMRLMINMTLGHMIISIMNNSMCMFIYLIMEMMIIIIQTYVFYILNLLNSNNMY